MNRKVTIFYEKEIVNMDENKDIQGTTEGTKKEKTGLFTRIGRGIGKAANKMGDAIAEHPVASVLIGLGLIAGGTFGVKKIFFDAPKKEPNMIEDVIEAVSDAIEDVVKE